MIYVAILSIATILHAILAFPTIRQAWKQCVTDHRAGTTGFSELSSDEHRARAKSWRNRIWIVLIVSYLAIIFLMINHIVTKNDRWTALPAVIFWVGAALMALMFIPLVRHDRKDDKFD